MPDTPRTWFYGYIDEDITLRNIKEDIAPYVDEQGRFDEDRSNAPYQIVELVQHVDKMRGRDRFGNSAIARVVRTAAQLVEKFPEEEGTESEGFTPALALEVAMIWEFG